MLQNIKKHVVKHKKKMQINLVKQIKYLIFVRNLKHVKMEIRLRNKIVEMSTRAAAYRYAEKCIKLHIVILGDNHKFWVVCFADAQKLVKLGYEIAE